MRSTEVLHTGLVRISCGRAALWTTLVLLLLLVPAASAQTPTPTIIAGTGEDITDDASRGDGGPATAARFHQVDGLDWTLGGNILVADGDDGRIRRITPSGNIVTNSTEGLADPIAVVGTGFYVNDPFERHNFVVSDVGDDTVEDWFLRSNLTWSGTAIIEDVDAHDVEAALDGYWVTDSANGTVWHITFTGPPFGTGWNQAEALPQDLDEPEGIGPLPGGGLLVATNGMGDCRIRRRRDGVTTVVAGTSGLCSGPTKGGNGDSGPATEAWLGFPIDVEATPDGGFVMIERDRVRHVAPDGTISTIFVTGFSVPDFPAPQPTALDVTPDGDVLIGLSRQVLSFDTNYAPPASTTPPPGGTNPLPPPPPGPDTTTPGLTLSGKKIQKAGKTVSVVVSATTEDLFASASGTVSVPATSTVSASAKSKAYRLKAISNRFVASGTKATLKLKVPKAALKAIKRALRARKKVKASIKLTARDGAGNLTTGKRTIKLKR